MCVCGTGASLFFKQGMHNYVRLNNFTWALSLSERKLFCFICHNCKTQINISCSLKSFCKHIKTFCQRPPSPPHIGPEYIPSRRLYLITGGSHTLDPFLAILHPPLRVCFNQCMWFWMTSLQPFTVTIKLFDSKAFITAPFFSFFSGSLTSSVGITLLFFKNVQEHLLE